MALIDQIIGVESGGNATAKNPNSSATGAGQFIAGTWLDMLARHRPDIQGSKEELLALRNDPTLSRAMTEAYAAENGQMLSKAGHQVTPGSTYLAHFAGPQGAVSVLNADPNAPVSQILGPAVVKANPFLANMTAADLRAWADRKMGGQTRQNAPASPAESRRAAPSPSVPLPAQSAQAAPMLLPMFGGSAPQAEAPSYFGQMPAAQAMPPPILPPWRKPIDLSNLRAALEASGNRGLLFPRG